MRVSQLAVVLAMMSPVVAHRASVAVSDKAETEKIQSTEAAQKVGVPRTCAKEGGKCDCDGKVYYGQRLVAKPGGKGQQPATFVEMKEADHKVKFVDKSQKWIKCNNKEFGGDPVPGKGKACFCETEAQLLLNKMHKENIQAITHQEKKLKEEALQGLLNPGDPYVDSLGDKKITEVQWSDSESESEGESDDEGEAAPVEADESDDESSEYDSEGTSDDESDLESDAEDKPHSEQLSKTASKTSTEDNGAHGHSVGMLLMAMVSAALMQHGA
jgi:hypothetical protein